MRIAIRVDASVDIGTGHLRRCLALAHALAEMGAQVRFVTRALGIDAPTLIESEGFAAIVLPAPGRQSISSDVPHAAWAEIDWPSDAEQTVAVLGKWKPSWVIVDHYAFDAGWHDLVRAALGSRIAVIDDLADRALAADLVVDHNYAPDHRDKYAGRLNRDAKLLGGPRFALLAPAYAAAPRYAPSETVRSIGVFMGGVDRDNLSATAIEAIADTGFEGEIEVVTTSANPNLPALREALPQAALVSVDVPDLAGFFARHDLQIGAGGGATWERCCIGAPTLLIVAAVNQLAVVPELAAAGIVATAEPLGATDASAIRAAISRLIAHRERRHALAERSRMLVDGLGARRVALRMLSDQVRVRPAKRSDGKNMHLWRNHPATRAVSRTSEAIAWPDHVTWLRRALSDPTRTLMVGMIGNVPIGVVRFDRKGDAIAEVSIYLDPALHGLGLGRHLLLAGEAALGYGLDIHAEVMDGNPISAGLFQSAGYRRIDENHWVKSAHGRPHVN